MAKEAFNDLRDIPAAFSSREGARRFAKQRESTQESLSGLEAEKLRKIVEVLKHPELEALIDEGKITLGIIKPNVNQSHLLPDNDDEASETILREIGEENVVFSIALALTRDQAEEFYAPIKSKYESKTDSKTGDTVWNLIVDFASSGPLTFLLIHREGGNAVDWWRNKMGNTYPADADKASIRGRFATMEMLPNNLVHGSDSKQEVKREIKCLAGFLGSLYETGDRV
ncbi:nucleoside-diphosphate kinase [Patescibacteria group bacterium]|nr:nucleoside-diphosphate kinase [Patescibacteria group bacterium]MCL5010411.1 nucleoside-diphosphate kinase [Patescibacteria group bacterium]